MGQIVGKISNIKRVNRQAIQSGGSQADVVLQLNEVWFVSSSNSLTASGSGKCDSYILGDGVTAAGSLQIMKTDDVYQFMDTEIHVSRNLFNKAAVISGRVVNSSTGGTSAKDGYNVSDYIPIGPEGVYLQNCYGGGTSIGYAIYNSSKVYIRGEKSGSGYKSYEDGDAYIRVTVADAHLNDAMVNNGSTAQEYEEYFDPYETFIFKKEVIPEGDPVSIAGVTFHEKEIGVNLLDSSLMVVGGINKDTGSLLANSNAYATDYIPLNGKNVGCLRGFTHGNHGGAAIYDENKQYIRAADSSRTAVYQSGDYYVRFSVPSTYKDIAVACYFDVSLRIFPYSAYSEKEVIDPDVLPKIPFSAIGFTEEQAGKNKFNKNKINPGFAINDEGGYNTSDSKFITDYIRITPNGLIANRSSYGSMNFNVYDEDYNVIRTVHGSNMAVYQDGDAFVVFEVVNGDIDTLRVEEGSVLEGDYEAYTSRKVISPDVLPESTITKEGLQKVLAQLNIYDGSVWIWLPNVIHAVVGDTLQVFFQSVLKSVDFRKYNILCQCPYGKQFHRYFEWTPDAATTTTLSLVVKDDHGNILGSASSTIVVSSVPASNASQKNILCVGSSTTANGIWPHEFDRRLTGTGGTPEGKGLGNITFVGSKEYQGTHYLGMSGWGWADYTTEGRGVDSFRFYLSDISANVQLGDVYSNNSHQYEVIEVNIIGGVLTFLGKAALRTDTPQASGTLTKVSGTGDATLTFTSYSQDSQNPFWDSENEKMTFIPYANAYCNGVIDYIYVMLGVNGLERWQTDFTEMLAHVQTFADTLHAEFPNAKMKLMSTYVPSMILMMPGAGATGTRRADVYGIINGMQNMRKAYQDFANQDEYSSFVEMVDVTSQVDSDYNFPITMKNVNTRNSSYQEGYANNTVHAGSDGYLQIADVAYRDFMNEL